MNPTKLKDFLRKRLMIDLPGFDSHKKMFPMQGSKLLRNTQKSKNARQSAVLVLLCFDESTDRLSILFTLRSSKLKKHSGQISFPGGKCDEGETYEQTALRETEEEVGICSDKIEVLGSLSELYVPPSNSVIYPIIGFTSSKLELRINPDEVEEAFYIELGSLLMPSTKKIQTQKFDKVGTADVPYFDVHSTTPLWGATAIILSEFLDLINEFEK